MIFEQAYQEFDIYVKKYLLEDDKYELKYNHTKRVVKLCEQLAKSTNCNSTEIELAKICGLLHDIGRFEQLKKYDTYTDYKSIDHGDLGVKILQSNNLLNKFCDEREFDDTILLCVKYHNKLDVPQNLTSNQKKIISIVRDADKLDILYLATENIKSSNEIQDKPIRNEIYQVLLNHQLINKQLMKDPIDKFCIWLAFVFDINEKWSYIYLLEKNYVSKIIDTYQEKIENSILKNQLQELKVDLNKYIKEKVGE